MLVSLIKVQIFVTVRSTTTKRRRKKLFFPSLPICSDFLSGLESACYNPQQKKKSDRRTQTRWVDPAFIYAHTDKGNVVQVEN